MFQVVLIAHESARNREKKLNNKLWKRVVPSETEFARLLSEILWAFYSDTLCRRRHCQYLAFNEVHMELQGRFFQTNIFLVDQYGPKRFCLGCRPDSRSSVSENKVIVANSLKILIPRFFFPYISEWKALSVNNCETRWEEANWVQNFTRPLQQTKLTPNQTPTQPQNKQTQPKRSYKTSQKRWNIGDNMQCGAVECSLFLGRSDQGLVGNAESTHVHRKGIGGRYSES